MLQYNHEGRSIWDISIYCSNPLCNNHTPVDIGDMEEPSFALEEDED